MAGWELQLGYLQHHPAQLWVMDTAARYARLCNSSAVSLSRLHREALYIGTPHRSVSCRVSHLKLAVPPPSTAAPYHAPSQHRSGSVSPSSEEMKGEGTGDGSPLWLSILPS